ncbi:MAG: hypothetical protein NVS3B16_14020 [Vulcanimicrobiaceae bacterium]
MPVALPTPSLGERFERAVTHAIRHPRHHRRAATDVAYVAYLFGVCALVLKHGGSEAEAVAALLRGTIDERANRNDQVGRLGSEFGADVAAILAACCDEPGADLAPRELPFYDRKLAWLERLCRPEAGDDSVYLIAAAETLYDAQTTHDALLRGEDAFAHLIGKKFGTLWAYRALADAYRMHGGRHRPIADALVELVDTLAGKPVTAAALLAAFAVDDTVGPREKGRLLAADAPR